MNELSKIISPDIWREAFNIVEEQVKSSSKSDLNLYLIKKHSMSTYDEAEINSLYKKLISHNFAFLYPSVCSTEKVYISKNLVEFREYRFFTFWGLVYYYSLSFYLFKLIETIEIQQSLTCSKVKSFAPSKFVKDNETFKIKSNYTEFYNLFVKEVEDTVDFNQVILAIDMSKFYNSIDHKIFLDLLLDFMRTSEKAKHGLDETSETLEFILNFLMLDDSGVPQGKRLYASDLIANFYLNKFDLNIEEIIKSQKIIPVKIVRYVDDILIFFDMGSESIENCKKEVVRVKKKIANWMHQTLKLDLNLRKTKIFTINDKTEKETFLSEFMEITSRVDDLSEIEQTMESYLSIIKKINFKTLEVNNFVLNTKERNILKYIYKTEFKNYLNTRLIDINSSLNSVDPELGTVGSTSLLSLYLYYNNKDKLNRYPFSEELISYLLSRGGDLSIKSNIEATIYLLLSIKYEEFKEKIIKNIETQKDVLLKDSLGKYLVLLSGVDYKKQQDGSDYSKSSIPFNIFNERSSIRRELDVIRSQLEEVSSIDANIKYSDVMIKQLTLFVYKYNLGHWGTAFNHFHSFYEEALSYVLRSESKKLKDTRTKLNRYNEINKLSPQDLIELMKFSDRRNFNIESHACNRSIPTVKVSRIELEKNVSVISKIFEKYNILRIGV